MADHLSLSPVVVADLGENDRSATGYLPKAAVLNTFREAGSAFGVAVFGALMVNNTVAGIQIAMLLSAALLVLASATAAAGISR